jgi:hypothetical protein
MILAVASGKGGTGKTTVSVNLARVLDSDVLLLDCDVEEPNDHLFLRGVSREAETVSIPVPQLDESLCDGCGERSFLRVPRHRLVRDQAARIPRDVSRLRGVREGVPHESHSRSG